mmetsp:Transcript_643/g.1359  ORF Transcript_643/g.1359 Transcript_643/m.1359 type:complete len:600 (-) Transcript_643:6-1805(-)
MEVMELKDMLDDEYEEGSDQPKCEVHEAKLTKAYIKRLEEDNERYRAETDARCLHMLEQGLSQSEHCDVKLVFDDGVSHVSAHRGMLCSASEEFRGMFRSGMVEERQGAVRIPPGISLQSVRGFLEWVYTGRAGSESARADGRELWLLSELYTVRGIREWLLKDGITDSSIMAAFEFSQVPEGERSEIAAACKDHASHGITGIDETALRGVKLEAAVEVMKARVHADLAGAGVWRVVKEGFEFAERWWQANEPPLGPAVAREGGMKLVAELDLGRLPVKVIRAVVEPSGLVDAERLAEVYQHKGAKSICEVEYAVERTFGLHGSGNGLLSDDVCLVALQGTGKSQRLAVADPGNHHVLIFSVETGDVISSVGTKGKGPGQFLWPMGVAFSPWGDLFVSDPHQDRIQVFDSNGRFLRMFGSEGPNNGELSYPTGIAFTPSGHLVVADGGNHRVQLLRPDGTFVRTIGSSGNGEETFTNPGGVAVGADGSIVVAAHRGHHGVHVFDEGGAFVRSIGSQGGGPGQFEQPWGVAVGPQGEVIVCDCGRKDVQVFSGKSGEHLQTIGPEGDSRVDLGDPWGVAVDQDGRLFVGELGRGHVVMLA